MNWNPFARLRKLEAHAKEIQNELENLRQRLDTRRLVSLPYTMGGPEISVAELDLRISKLEKPS